MLQKIISLYLSASFKILLFSLFLIMNCRNSVIIHSTPYLGKSEVETLKFQWQYNYFKNWNFMMTGVKNKLCLFLNQQHLAVTSRHVHIMSMTFPTKLHTQKKLIWWSIIVMIFCEDDRSNTSFALLICMGYKLWRVCINICWGSINLHPLAS